MFDSKNENKAEIGNKRRNSYTYLFLRSFYEPYCVGHNLLEARRTHKSVTILCHLLNFIPSRVATYRYPVMPMHVCRMSTYVPTQVTYTHTEVLYSHVVR